MYRISGHLHKRGCKLPLNMIHWNIGEGIWRHEQTIRNVIQAGNLLSKQAKDSVDVILYTDGACSGNPGPGGWAYILHHVATGTRAEKNGGSSRTTNNRMELRAVLHGLQRLKRPCLVRLVSDSKYVLQGMQEWMPGWKRRGWKRQEGRKLKPVKNADLWKQIDEEMSRHTIRYEHVLGHSGHPENERCDELAVAVSQTAVADNLPQDMDGSEDTENGLD